MKKLVVLFSMMFFIMGSALAQKGIQAAGVNLSYGTKAESIGIGVKYQYNITDNIRLEPSMNYYFNNNYTKHGEDVFDINANAHYLVPMASNIRVYPLAGLTFARWNFQEVLGGPWSDVITRLGVNLGGGAEMDITDQLMLNFELKYQFVSDFDQAVFNIGIAYMF
jgi:outer membrane protein X